MVKRDFAPGFRIRLHQGILNPASGAAREMGVAPPDTAAAQRMFSACTARGMADQDHPAPVAALDLLADSEIAPPE